MRCFKAVPWGVGLLIAGLVAVACGTGLPSATELGGEEQTPPVALHRVAHSNAAPGPKSQAKRPARNDAGAKPHSLLDAGVGVSVTPAGDADAGVADASDASLALTDAAPACDDTSGPGANCQAIRGSCAALYLPLCELSSGLLKPKVAATLGECLERRSEECVPIRLFECFAEAAKVACPAPGVADVCADFTRRCGEPEGIPKSAGKDFCANALSSLNDDIRQDVSRCLERQCDVKACLAPHIRP